MKGVFMTRAEAREWLKTNLGIEEPTEEQVSKYLDSMPKPSEPNKDEMKRLRDVEKAYNDLVDSKKTDADRIAELNKRISKQTAESVLKAHGMTEEDYKDFIDSIVSENEDTTKALAESVGKTFKAKLDAQKASLEEEFDEKIKGLTPNPGGTGGHEDDKPDDVKNIEKLNIGGNSENYKNAIDYYK